MSDNPSTESTNEPAPAQPTEPTSLINSLWSKETSQKAWGWWDSVKSSQAIQQRIQAANERLQQAQKQANQAYETLDTKTVTSKLTELGRSATQYIDDADRKLEALENKTLGFLQHEGTRLAEIAAKAVDTDEKSSANSEILYNGPEKPLVSRLDAELMAMHASPDQFLAPISKAVPETDRISETERTKLLETSSDLHDTYNSLVPATITPDEFWTRYAFNKSRLVQQDKRRKQLIERQTKTQDFENLNDWGSSDEDEPSPQSVAPTKQSPNKPADHNDGSDDDWE